MAKLAAVSRLNRLEQLKGLLKACEHTTATALAEELGISLRTLNRDLGVLRQAGVPVESDRGRGGGLRLERRWALGRLHLSLEEAIDLLLSMAIAEQIKSPMLLDHLAPVRRKIVAAFGEAYQSRIRLLRKRILVGAPASAGVLAGYREPSAKLLSGVSQAFFNLRRVEIEYVDGQGAPTRREIEPQFLYLSPPVWYLLAFDRLRGDIRCFRADRIKEAKPLPASFRLADPKPYLACAEAAIRSV
jgi:predicted DNA-binding transcriptional regulator YafY